VKPAERRGEFERLRGRYGRMERKREGERKEQGRGRGGEKEKERERVTSIDHDISETLNVIFDKLKSCVNNTLILP
jgi:hypothetical protein